MAALNSLLLLSTNSDSNLQHLLSPAEVSPTLPGQAGLSLMLFLSLTGRLD